MPRKKLIFILNPITAPINTGQLRDLLIRELDKDLDFDIIETAKAGDAGRFAEKAAKDEYDIIVAVGGDGTVNEISKPLIGSGTILGILPAGSGNGLARHLHIPLNISEAIRTINKLHVIDIDTASVNGRHFVSIAGIGFDSKIANASKKSGKRGFETYFKLIVTHYLKYKTRSFKLSFDGKKIEREALFISFANSGQFGYNTIIAPQADICDGLLDVVIVKKFPLWEIPDILRLLFTRRIHKSSYTESFRASELKVWREKGKRINIDGESVKMGRMLHFKVHPRSLKVLVPGNRLNS